MVCMHFGDPQGGSPNENSLVEVLWPIWVFMHWVLAVFFVVIPSRNLYLPVSVHIIQIMMWMILASCWLIGKVELYLISSQVGGSRTPIVRKLLPNSTVLRHLVSYFQHIFSVKPKKMIQALHSHA